MLRRPSPQPISLRAAAIVLVLLAAAGLVPFRLVARTPSIAPIQPAHESRPVGAVVGPTLHAWNPVDLLRRSLTGGAAEGQDKPAPSAGSGIRFILMTGDRTTMSGSTDDLDRMRRLRSGNEDLLWFEKDGRQYIVRDADVLRDVSRIWGAVNAVGAEQGEIGARQAAVGAQQAEVGQRQAAVGAQQASIGVRQSEIGEQQAILTTQSSRKITEAERKEIGERLASLDAELSELDRLMRVLEEKQRELDGPTTDYIRDMERLAREMEVLEKKMQGAQREAEARMRELVERAIASGAARPVR